MHGALLFKLSISYTDIGNPHGTGTCWVPRPRSSPDMREDTVSRKDNGLGIAQFVQPRVHYSTFLSLGFLDAVTQQLSWRKEIIIITDYFMKTGVMLGHHCFLRLYIDSHVAAFSCYSCEI